MASHPTDNQAATGAEALSLVSAAVTGFCGARFAGALLATASFAVAFVTAAFFAGVGFVTALTFFAATVFPVTFFVAAFFAAAFLGETAFESEAPSAAATIRNFERSLAPANHAGAGPRPLHVAPLFGSRYFGARGPFT
ncbi:hypothetical protein CBA19C8_33985 [Paraburkholderia terrae]|nr:hypothetical protein CBA19C8_33985 [Paraburkholderia terrae]